MEENPDEKQPENETVEPVEQPSTPSAAQPSDETAEQNPEQAKDEENQNEQRVIPKKQVSQFPVAVVVAVLLAAALIGVGYMAYTTTSDEAEEKQSALPVYTNSDATTTTPTSEQLPNSDTTTLTPAETPDEEPSNTSVEEPVLQDLDTLNNGNQ